MSDQLEQWVEKAMELNQEKKALESQLSEAREALRIVNSRLGPTWEADLAMKDGIIRKALSPRQESDSKITMPGVAHGVKSVDGHWSDCATHNEPALPNGPCDCGGYVSPRPEKHGPCRTCDGVGPACQGARSHPEKGARDIHEPNCPLRQSPEGIYGPICKCTALRSQPGGGKAS